MAKALADQIFAFSIAAGARLAYERCSAADVGMAESWMRDAIFQSPELVVGACRAAGLCDDEEWFPWHKEYQVSVGSVDVLLLSATGRVGIVETKLASNPEMRRRVLAQVLDYVTHLPDGLREDMPPVPTDGTGRPVAHREDILASVDEGDVLVVVAGDEIDPRVARLSQGLLGGHLVKHWDLALVDLAVYRPTDGNGQHLLVPCVVGSTVSEARQVVRIIVQGETPQARISVEQVTGDETTTTSQKWNEERFFERIDTELGASAVRDLAMELRKLSRSSPSLVLAWGRGQKDGSMTVKRQGGGLIEVYSSGWLGFRPRKFARALGDEMGDSYRRALETIIPKMIGTTKYLMVPPDEAKQVAPQLLEAVRAAVDLADRGLGQARSKP
jgi:hypothetical protein